MDLKNKSLVKIKIENVFIPQGKLPSPDQELKKEIKRIAKKR